ncbi:MAG: YceG family protein [bacterium]|nr:YceG family protein [bacterium]
MFQRITLSQLNDYFKKLSERERRGVYFYRINGLSKKTEEFLLTYLQEAKRNGIVCIGKIPNPDERQLAYYEEMMGMEFRMDPAFFNAELKRWLPRLEVNQRENVAGCIYDTLLEMRKAGKNDNMLKNAYIKFMCWMYYKFERILKSLGQEQVPKILYEGEISTYELKMLRIIAVAGCDIVLIQKKGDQSYLRLDPKSEESFAYTANGESAFPEEFSITSLQKTIEKKERLSILFNESLTRIAATNTWLSGEPFKDTLVKAEARGEERTQFYNSFLRIIGVEDKAAYCNELFHWKEKIESQGRNFFVLEELPVPTLEEVNQVNRNNYTKVDQLLFDMTGKIQCSINRGLENQIRKAFAELIVEESGEEQSNLNRLKNYAVYLICWYRRYEKQLFANYKESEIGVFVYFGVCKTKFEALFLRLLAGLPLDVLIIEPDRTKSCMLKDARLFEKVYENSMQVQKFPLRPNDVSYGTVAYHAEQDLTTLLYQDSGMYREQQYKRAVTISLQTMYEELFLLWDQEATYRPNFETLQDEVIVPVMISKVSGVKDGNITKYWQEIKKLIVEDTIVIKNIPYVTSFDFHCQSATMFLKNRKLQRNVIKSHPSYMYGICRKEIQEHLLDKLQELLDSGLIKGTYSQGVEYKIISVALELNKELMRQIQKIDFTKKLPKLILLCTTEKMCSLEDSILIAYLHLLGFDIVMFVPTGYQVIEQHYTRPLFVEHQIGTYLYDLQIPNFNKISYDSHSYGGLMNKIFKRG